MKGKLITLLVLVVIIGVTVYYDIKFSTFALVIISMVAGALAIVTAFVILMKDFDNWGPW